MPVPDLEIVPEAYDAFDLTMRFSRDLKRAAALMSPTQQRTLVDMYYQIQEARKASANQQRAAHDEPNEFLVMLAAYLMKLERMIVSALDVVTDQTEVSRWAKLQTGIGPVLAAGFAAHIDITRAPTASAIWKFAGLDPTSKWEKGQKRPWNARLKVLQWRLGDCFMKFHNHPTCFYGQVYAERKAVEVARNESGVFAAQAASSLASRTFKDKALRETYAAGRLPAGRLELRARRVAVKLFLAHYFEVAYTEHYGKRPQKAYILQYDPDHHQHYIPPPLWDPAGR